MRNSIAKNQQSVRTSSYKTSNFNKDFLLQKNENIFKSSERNLRDVGHDAAFLAFPEISKGNSQVHDLKNQQIFDTGPIFMSQQYRPSHKNVPPQNTQDFKSAPKSPGIVNFSDQINS